MAAKDVRRKGSRQLAADKENAPGSLIVTLRVASQGLTQLSPKLSRLNKFDESRSGESFGEHQALVVLTNLSHRPKEMLFVPQNDFKHLTRHDPESIN